MRDDLKMSVQVGTVVQMNQYAPDPRLVGNFMVVLDPRAWGAEGYMHVLSESGNAERIPMKLQWREMEFVGQASMVQRLVKQ